MRLSLALKALAASTLILAPVPALAGNGQSKASLGYTHYEGSGGGELGLITGRYHYDFGKWIGAEAQISYGVDEEEVTTDAATADVSAKFGYGGFITLRQGWGLYGSDVFLRGGYATQEIEADVTVEQGSASATDDVDGVAYGAGTNLMFTPHFGLRLDYLAIEGDDSDVDTYSGSLVFRF